MLKMTAALAALGLLAFSAPAQAQETTIAGAPCGPLAPGAQNNAVEPKSGRPFFLEYPCGLKAGDKVTVILNLHGGGSSGNYQRRYFPAGDFAAKHKLVVVTPTAAAQPPRRWTAEADDRFLQELTDLVMGQLGKPNVRAFWLAGHSQGGMTSRRIICTPFFKDKVDGFVSLSGGRVGGAATLSPHFYRADQLPQGQKADPPVAPARPRPATAAPTGPDEAMACDYSHIFAIGEYEIEAMPERSALAERFGCTARQRREVVDDQPGYVHDPGRQNPATLGWGRLPAPGKAQMWVWQGCRGGRVVADVMRMDKGHTEGLEPKVTEAIVELMVAARGR